jgi:membrane fusion protein, heavy metal efflux system
MRLKLAIWAWVVALAATLGGAADSRAHEGHDHGAPPPPVTATIAPRTDASSNDFELVVVARNGQLTIYLDTFRGNAPISGASIEIDTPAGILTPTPAEPGTYVVAASFAEKPGSHDLAFTVTAGELVDVLTATLVIPEAAGQAAGAPQAASWMFDNALAGGLSQRVAGWEATLLIAALGGFVAGGFMVFLLLRNRRAGGAALLAALLMPLGPEGAQAAEAVASVAARDISQRLPDGALFVPKSTQRILGIRTVFTETARHRRSLELPGRVMPDPNASGLVQASVSGRLTPPEGGFKPLGTRVKAGEVLARVRPSVDAADVTTQQQQARELDQQISLVSRKLERLKAIERVVARGQIEDAELELQGLRTRRANLDRMTVQAEALIAPVDGVIAESNAVAGQMAQPNAVIFRIVEPSRLWVEALSFAPDALEGSAQGRRADGRIFELSYVGTGLADRNQAVPVQFAIVGTPAAGLRIGEFLTVLASTADQHEGIALPREAILRSANGQSIVYEHTNAERFVAREVRVEALDAERVLVVAGIEPGRRIVGRGAELLNQIR